MKWDTYHTKDINQKYIYRYITLEKLVDFLKTNCLYLTRLDKFEDNLENIDPYDINELKFRQISKPNNANPEISDSTWKEIIKKNHSELKNIQQKLILQQKNGMLVVGY